MKEFFNNLGKILAAEICNVLCFAGVVFILLAFVQFQSGKLDAITATPCVWPFAIGVCLLAGGVLLYFLRSEYKPFLHKADLHKGFSMLMRSVEVRLKVGDMATIPSLNMNSAIVLPANTSFLDDCITDRNSALGSFFLTNFANDISNLTKTMQETLGRSNYQRNAEGVYPPGTTIILPSPFDRPCPLLITASTVRKPQVGIVAKPTTVCDCIRNIFSVTADRKIHTLYMPILGSGHGGLEKHEALLFLLLSIRHYSKDYHHIKKVEVVILERDLPVLGDVRKLQHLSFLEAQK